MRTGAVSLVVGLALVPALGLSQAPGGNTPDIAYGLNGVLYLATRAGKVVRSIRTEPPLSTFSISVDAATVIFAPRGRDGYGGPLYQLDVKDGRTTRLTHGAYFSKATNPDEVYSDPDLSPDGKQAVFAIHAQSSGDAVEASGPFAIIDLSTGKVRLLRATMHLPFTGVAFANDPHWSPDGSEILLNCEADAAVIASSGEHFHDLSALMGGAEWSHGVGWLGSQCVVYVAGKSPKDASRQPAQILNLGTSQSRPLSRMINLGREATVGVVAISGSTLIRNDAGRLEVITSSGKWSIPGDAGSVQVRIVDRGEAGWIPQSCKQVVAAGATAKSP